MLGYLVPKPKLVQVVLGCIIKDTYLTEIMNVVDFLIAMKIAHFFGNKKVQLREVV